MNVNKLRTDYNELLNAIYKGNHLLIEEKAKDLARSSLIIGKKANQTGRRSKYERV